MSSDVSLTLSRTDLERRMTRDEVEACAYVARAPQARPDAKRSGAEDPVRAWNRSDARRVIVRRGLIERTDERASLIVANHRVIQPIDPMQRSQHRRHRPLALCRVRERDLRDLAGGVVPRENAIALANPPIVAAVIF